MVLFGTTRVLAENEITHDHACTHTHTYIHVLYTQPHTPQTNEQT